MKIGFFDARSRKENILRITIFLIAVLLISSCNRSESNKEFKAVIFDKTKILQDSTIQKISSYKYPAGFLYMIRTVDSADIRVIGNVADNYFWDDRHEHYDFTSFDARGVYIFVSTKPSFIQLRTGYKIRLLANWNGITSGKEYINIQKIAINGDLDKAVLNIIDYTATALPQHCNLPWLQKYIFEHFDSFNSFSSLISSRFEYSKLSPDSFYSKYVLKPIFEFHLKVGNLGLSYILLFAIVFLTTYIVNAIIFSLILSKLSKAFTNSGKFLLSNLIVIAFLVPAINSRGMLIGSRMEDRLKLEYLNIEGFQNYVFPNSGYVNTTSWWLAIIFVLLFFLNKIPGLLYRSKSNSFTSEEQLKNYALYKKDNPIEALLLEIRLGALTKRGIDYYMEEKPYEFITQRYLLSSFFGGIFMGISFWLFLPKSFTVVSIYLMIITTIIGFGSFFIDEYRESRSQQ